MTEKQYLQRALAQMHSGQWFGFRKEWTGSKRESYENIILNDDGAILPSEAEVNAKIQEIKDAETNLANKKASGKQKLLDLGLTEEEVKALIGV